MSRIVLPVEFVKSTRELMGEERFSRYLAAFDEEPPVSIRINPRKVPLVPLVPLVSLGSLGSLAPSAPLASSVPLAIASPEAQAVPWCRNAYYLPERPNFTFDPLLHAGCYYVQEAASMFLDTVLRQEIVNCQLSNCKCLDLCAAPGGKSTLMRTALPEGCVLYSNEPVRQRASILSENITKWGWPDCIVTNNYPRDYVRSGLKFDVILCDVPCSGEGMFRKDPQTIGEWSPQNVEKCWRLQRDIVSDAWQCLNDGGLLIYSTCTFNTKENEENVRWILDTFDAVPVSVDVPVDVPVPAEWGITGSLLPGFDVPVYRFIPGITRSEGLFMAVLRKSGKRIVESGKRIEESGKRIVESGKRIEESGKRKVESGKRKENCLSILPPPSTFNPPPSTLTPPPSTDLSYQQAIAYLRGEALVLPPDTPRGIVTVSYQGHPLGLVKNLGTRANNLYPKEWRIKSTYIPPEPPEIVK